MWKKPPAMRRPGAPLVFNFVKETRDRMVVFHLEGSLSLEETAALRQVFWECINASPVSRLILNLALVDRLDSSVISLFVATKNVISKRDGELVLAGLNARNYAMLEDTNLHQYFDIRRDVDDAMRAKKSRAVRPGSGRKGAGPRRERAD